MDGDDSVTALLELIPRRVPRTEDVLGVMVVVLRERVDLETDVTDRARGNVLPTRCSARANMCEESAQL